MLKSNMFLIISVAVGLVVVSTLLLLYRSITTNSMIEQEQRANTNIAFILSNVILPEFKDSGNHPDKLYNLGLQNPAQLKRLDDMVTLGVVNTNILKVKVINLNGLVIYSSDPTQIGDSKYTSKSFNLAISGVPDSSFSYRDTFAGINNIQLTDRQVVSTYIPAIEQESGNIFGAFEIYSDVTDLVAASNRVQFKVGSFVVLAMLILYLVLFAMARRASELVKAKEQERLKSAAQVQFQAYHDQLTGLPNRLSFGDRIVEALSRAKREKYSVAVMFLDIDRFKLINDSLGHHAGDELLRIITYRLQLSIRERDFLFRMGGDEFTIIAETLEEPGDAAHLADRILQAIKEPIEIEGTSIIATTSIGISFYPKDDLDCEKLVKNADAAMYQSKQNGRNQFCFYTEEMNSQASNRLTLESALQQAVRNNEFVLHYQPRVDTDSGAIIGIEALIRWERPGQGLVQPNDFIPVLEDSNLIVSVGEWVLRTAAQQMHDWIQMGMDPTRVSVNVSSRQFRMENFVAVVKSAIEDAGILPEQLELELTESLLLDNTQNAIKVMTELKELGVKLSIDDFGTGYSSLNYLKVLPIDYLKIDRAFIKDVTTNQKDAAIVNTITTLARELKIGVVAEGVETEAQWIAMRDKHCQELQGFYFSRPLPAAEVEELLNKAKLETA